MFILPPNCMVPSASSLTISPVLPSFRNFIFTLLPLHLNYDGGFVLFVSETGEKLGAAGRSSSACNSILWAARTECSGPTASTEKKRPVREWPTEGLHIPRCPW